MRIVDFTNMRKWLRAICAQPYFSLSPSVFHISLIILMTIIAVPAIAQKKQLSQARDILKKGKNVEQAEKLMTTLLKDSANLDNKRIYDVWLESVMKQYEQANEKLYLKQKQDTAAFFALTSRLFTIAEKLDSIDMRPLPPKKGKQDSAAVRTNIEYRKEHAEQLVGLRANLFNGGTYHVRKGSFQKAFDFFEQYLDCRNQPLFSSYQLEQTDSSRMAEAAYWATYCGYRLQNPLYTLRYRTLALADTAKAAFTLQYMTEARRWLKDDSLYMETLREGFRRYPTNAYFFPRLTDYYIAHGDHEAALALANSALATDSSRLYRFAKATALFNLQRYDECIALSDTLIAMNDSLPEPYYLAGTAVLNKALRLDALRHKKLLRKYYQKAQQYMERYRLLAPDDKQKWGPALYRIYLNLNLGRQFDEIDRLLKN